VLATQCLIQRKARNYRVQVSGRLAPGVYAKDLILAVIGRIGTAGATGHTIEYMGEAIRALSMEGRMTICNMAIEAGARAGMVAVDDTTLEYVHGRRSRRSVRNGTRPRPGGAPWCRIRTHRSTGCWNWMPP